MSQATRLRCCLGAALFALALLGLFNRAIAAPAQLISFPGKDVTLQGWLYLPDGPGPHPAVVALHGCGGIVDKSGRPGARPEDWGQRLTSMGFVVLFPDSFTSRKLGPQCRTAERDARPSHERTDDANAALAYLAGRPDVKASAISLLGWSNGGTTVLYGVEPRHKPAGTVDFAKAVAFYPGCHAPLAGHWQTRLPLMILIGGADDWTAAEPCRQLTDAANAQHEVVDLTVYPGAYHEFDDPHEPVHELNGLAFTADNSGHAHAGTNPAARADAIQRVPAYLAR
jgi:dienelactone hydrolase